MFCSKCGRETAEGALFCDGCGASLAGADAANGAGSKRTTASTAAGVIDLIDGILKLGFAALCVLAILINVAGNENSEDVPGQVVMAVVLLLLGALSVAGGYSALRRQTWGLALAGSIAAAMPFFPLGIASVILTIMAKDEFAKRQPGMPQQQRTRLM